LTWTPSQLHRKAIVEAGGTATANNRKGADEALITWAIDTGRAVNIGRKPIQNRGLPACGWGNPFEMVGKSDAERDRVCHAHEGWLNGQTDLLARLPELREKVLICWCHPKRCHGDALIERLEAQP
jgi:hypothetical protein